MSDPTQASDFDAADFWQKRMSDRPDLTGTGTSGLPLAWQKWMYRGKKRAYRKLLRNTGVEIRNADVFDFGCGTGYFEDVWLKWGAARADGVDIATANIDRLKREHPERAYLCGDIARQPLLLEDLPQYDLVTAIDVIYHVVDDELLARTIEALAAKIKPGGWFLFTDAMRDHSPAVHVQFRSRERWADLLGKAGLELGPVAPVFDRNNRATKLARRRPWLAGAVYHIRDGLRMNPDRVNNWVALARKPKA